MPLFQKPVPALPSSLGLSGKTALVTGANRGLGYTTSQHFVRHGISKLVLAVRSRQAGETTRETLLQEAAGRKDGQTLEIIVRELDMNSLASVSAFVRGLEADELQVHIALLNAGINKMEWSVSEETGNESVFQVNYVSTAALSLLLLPILIRTSEASGSCSYLTVVGSEMQGMSSWNKKKVAPASVFGEFNNKSTFSGFTRYQISRLPICASLGSRGGPREDHCSCYLSGHGCHRIWEGRHAVLAGRASETGTSTASENT